MKKKWTSYLVFALVCLGVLLVLRLIRPQTLSSTYSLRFPDIYASAPTVEIAGFTEGEGWKGMYTFDNERSIDGETGMNMFSINGAPAEATLLRRFNLKAYKSISSYIYVTSAQYAQNIDSLTIALTDSKNNMVQHNVTGLKSGWNYIMMKTADFAPSGKADLSDIASVSVKLVSKKGENTQITLDRIWAQPPMRTGDFARADFSYTNLETINKRTFLHFSSPVPVSAFFTKSTSASRFSYTVGLSPMKMGTFGLVFGADPRNSDGYYFLVTGKQMDRWHFLKKTNGRETELQQGKLSANTFENGAMVWMKTDKNGSTYTLSLSVNGQRFVPIATVKDGDYYRGSFGVLSSGSFLVESVDVKE